MTNPTTHGQVPEALRFTKKPVTIEAIQWTGKNLREVITFTDGPPGTRSHHAGMAWEAYADLVARDGLMIYTLEDGPDRRAKHFADIGDWIIRGVKGEYYPCKPDIFEATYERAAHVQNPSENQHGQVPAIQRYKIGYHADEWGMRSTSPSGIYDATGPWVRYEDHAAVITAIRTQQPSPTPQAASQPAEVWDYPPLPDFDTVEQHIYGACRRYITRDILEPIHNLIRDAIDADRAARVTRQTA